MGACCSLFSRRSAKAASLVPGKRGAVTPLGEPSLVPCSRACAAICLEPEACLTVQGLLCVHLGKAPNLPFTVLFALFHRIARQLLDSPASRLSGCTVARQRLLVVHLGYGALPGNLQTSSLLTAAPGARQRPSSGGSCGADARGHRRWAHYRRWRRPRLPQRAESPAGEVRCPILPPLFHSPVTVNMDSFQGMSGGSALHGWLAGAVRAMSESVCLWPMQLQATSRAAGTGGPSTLLAPLKALVPQVRVRARARHSRAGRGPGQQGPRAAAGGLQRHDDLTQMCLPPTPLYPSNPGWQPTQQRPRHTAAAPAPCALSGSSTLPKP